jgi:predicted TPR repeat methyltransferase
MDNEAEAILARAYALKDAAQARALYRDWARTYDETMLSGLGYLTPSRTAELLAAYLADKSTRILDAGSGTGLAGVELARLGFHNLDALDFSREMLAVAQARDIYGNLVEADLTRPLPLADASYDAIISTGTFTHGHVGASCLHELFRVLRRGGIFACTVHRDVWHAAGFEETTRELALGGRLVELWREPGTYYAASTEPEGYFCAWLKPHPET